MTRPKGSKNKPKQIMIDESTPVQLGKETVLLSMNHMEIRAEDLEVDNMNMRASEEKDPELEEDIKANGLINSLLVRPKGKGKFGIVAGSRRFLDGKKAGIDLFPCVVRSMDDITAKSRSLAENKFQKPLEAYEYQRSLKELYNMIEKSDRHLTSQKEIIGVIHSKTGFSESTIKGYLQIAEHGTPELKEALKTGKLSDSRIAQDVSRLSIEKQKEVIPKIEGKPRAETKEILETVTAKPRAKIEPLTRETELTFPCVRTISEVQKIRHEVCNATGNNAKFSQDEWAKVDDKYKQYAFAVGVEQILNWLEDPKTKWFEWLFGKKATPTIIDPKGKPVYLTDLDKPEYITGKSGKCLISIRKR